MNGSCLKWSLNIWSLSADTNPGLELIPAAASQPAEDELAQTLFLFLGFYQSSRLQKQKKVKAAAFLLCISPGRRV